jgi:hypothetical protein
MKRNEIHRSSVDSPDVPVYYGRVEKIVQGVQKMLSFAVPPLNGCFFGNVAS